MYNHPNNAFYFSVWQYYSRPATTRGAPYPGIAVLGNNTGNSFIALQPWEVSNSGGTQQPPANFIGYNFAGTLGVAGNGGAGTSLWQGGVTKFTGALPGTSAGFVCMPFIWGGTGGPFSGYPHVGPSQIFYRCYLEDRTPTA
jgi:hypothetical protein